jgi:hypothetical protein
MVTKGKSAYTYHRSTNIVVCRWYKAIVVVPLYWCAGGMCRRIFPKHEFQHILQKKTRHVSVNGSRFCYGSLPIFYNPKIKNRVFEGFRFQCL